MIDKILSNLHNRVNLIIIILNCDSYYMHLITVFGNRKLNTIDVIINNKVHYYYCKKDIIQPIK